MTDLLAIAIETKQALMGNMLWAGDPALDLAAATGHDQHERFLPERQEQLILTTQGFDPEPSIADTAVEQRQLYCRNGLTGQPDKSLDLTGGDIRFYPQLQRQPILPLSKASAQGLRFCDHALSLWVQLPGLLADFNTPGLTQE
ncbi:hypothetical protein D3C77_561780 [compost metagenome]